MPDDTILCWTWPKALQHLLPSPKLTRHVTVKDCKDWLDDGDAGRYKLAEFSRQRLRERYIDPVDRLEAGDKNGFSIMALSCLLVETLETFKQGWESSEGRCYLAFSYFFDREARFHDFKGYAQEFYKHVRCDILHQGETTGGWTICRSGALFEPGSLKVNATEFHKRLSQLIDDYRDDLKREPLSAEVWQKFKTKMKATIENCERS